MSEVFSIRIKKNLKEEMDRLKNIINWKEEIVRFIEEKIRYYRKLHAIEEIHETLEKHPTLPRGSVVTSVREDRDSH